MGKRRGITIKMFLKDEEEEEKGKKKEKSLFIVLRHLSADRKKRRSRKILTKKKKKKKIRNQPQWKYEGVTFKKKENGRHRLTRGSEKTGQCGRWGRAGPRPLRLEKLVQVKMKQERLLCLEPKRSWGFGGETPLAAAVLVLGCESKHCS